MTSHRAERQAPAYAKGENRTVGVGDIARWRHKEQCSFDGICSACTDLGQQRDVGVADLKVGEVELLAEAVTENDGLW